MGFTSAEWALLGSTVILGLRHGVDYDHIAAISDIVGMQRGVGRGTLLGAAYAIGHGLVVMILIALAATLGAQVPSGVDAVMGKAVGITLVVLGLLVLRSLFSKRPGERLPTRYALISEAVRSVTRLFRRHSHDHSHPSPRNSRYGVLSSIGVGVVHGIGAETPTQILLIVLAAGFSSASFAVLVGAVFVAGLLITNAAMCTVLALTSDVTLRRPWVYRSLMGASAAYSLVMGALFTTGLDGGLPSVL